ncbi:hypothetical protein [Allopusillimonas ginsengisoli]|uniref:hypothetical protein n=1 Tax=Allopusillimonas ginsengisoli TaxID=453575 RepID=UPI00101F4465|nr:hypothetical protein [Allopusillimonas ginsengisoli]TEA79812.1 hypothetical protein ERE07_02400 [Allopusillimonas ginsengisoli]
MKIHRSIEEPLRDGLTTNELWFSDDSGLIACWERGRKMATERPEVAADAVAGVLIELPWAGGLAKAIKTGKKYGSYRYLAMWQGLRGQDLDVDPSRDTLLICSRFGATVTFTSDLARFG